MMIQFHHILIVYINNMRSIDRKIKKFFYIDYTNIFILYFI